MPNDDLTATTPGAACASYPSTPMEPIPADQDRDELPFAADHMHPPHGEYKRHGCNGRLLPPPNSDEPYTARLLHTAEPHAALTLWLTDFCGEPGSDLLTIKDDKPRGASVTGTGEELADLAGAILRYTMPADARRIGRALRAEAEQAYSNNENDALHALAQWIDPAGTCTDPACGIATMPGECPIHNPAEPEPMDEPSLPEPAEGDFCPTHGTRYVACTGDACPGLICLGGEPHHPEA